MDKNTKLGIGFGTALALITGTSMFAYAESLSRQLQIGMSGSDVGILQTFLARDFNIYPEARITNYFGNLTKAAVVRFQVKNGIYAVGRVGPQTMGVINSQMGNLGGPVSIPQVAPIKFTSVINNNNGTVNVNWTTPTNTRGTIYYSSHPLSAYEYDNSVAISGSTVDSNIFSNNHSVQIPGISATSTYYFVIYTTDQSGEVDMTWPMTFMLNGNNIMPTMGSVTLPTTNTNSSSTVSGTVTN